MGIEIKAGHDVTVENSVVSADEVGGDKVEDGRTRRLSLPNVRGMVTAAAKVLTAAVEVVRAKVGF